MTLARAIRTVISLAATFALLAGCGGGTPPENVVASAGDLTVTLAEFQEAYNKITPNYRPDISTAEGRHAFAEDLINKAILLAESARLGGITDPQILQAMDGQIDQGVLGVLYREEVEDKVEVLGSDVKNLWDKRHMNVRASHILLESPADAKRVKAEIESGKIKFEDAAAKYSMDLSSKRKGGALGELSWGRSLPEFQDYAFQLEPGVVSDPLETVFGTHLIRVEERLPQEIGTLEEMRTALRGDARNQLEAVRLKEFLRSLEEKVGLTWNDDGIALVQDLVRPFATMDPDTIPAELRYLPNPTPDQRSVVIATFSGRNWTVGDYADAIAALPPSNRIQRAIPRSGIRELIRTQHLQNILLLEEARARGLDQRPEVLDKVQRMREQIAIELVHTRFIQSADVPPEDVKALYDSSFAADPEKFRIPEQVDMQILVHTHKATVERALAEIRGGADEADVVNRYSLDNRTKSKAGRTGKIGRGSYSPEIEDIAFTRPAGRGWTDPIVTATGTGTIKVLEHFDSRLATLEDVEASITNQMAKARGEQAFEEWLKAERERRGVKIYDDVLELIGQPVS